MFAVFLGYLWYTVVSLYQIIIVVNSSEYRMLFGNDPLAKKVKRKDANMAAWDWTPNVVENVKFYSTPDSNSFKKSLKLRDTNSHMKFQPTTLSMGGQYSSSYLNTNQLLRNNYYPNPNNRSYGYF